jgi:prepilin-type processing-associated H-X9-DG protein
MSLIRQSPPVAETTLWWPEAVLLLAVGLVLCALGFPAVLSARESQRKLLCQHRLQRLGTALTGYESAHTTLPPGVLWGRFQYDAPRTNYYAHLLPILGAETLQPVAGVTWCSPVNFPVTSRPQAELLCPADGLGGAVKDNLRCGPHAVTNYMACFGPTMADVLPGRGPFFVNAGLDLATVEKGRASLLLMAEYISGTPTDLRGGLWGDEAGMSLLFTDLTPNSTQPDLFYPNPRLCDPQNPVHNNPSANMPCALGDGYIRDTVAARSRHSGGVNALFADGRIQFVSNRVDPELWRDYGLVSPSRFQPGKNFPATAEVNRQLIPTLAAESRE